MDLKSAFRQAPAYLRLLIVMRAVAIAAVVAILYCFDGVLGVQLPLGPLAALIALYAALDVATLLRLPAPVTQLEMLGQLLADVAILSAVLYFTGGARNP